MTYTWLKGWVPAMEKQNYPRQKKMFILCKEITNWTDKAVDRMGWGKRHKPVKMSTPPRGTMQSLSGAAEGALLGLLKASLHTISSNGASLYPK